MTDARRPVLVAQRGVEIVEAAPPGEPEHEIVEVHGPGAAREVAVQKQGLVHRLRKLIGF